MRPGLQVMTITTLILISGSANAQGAKPLSKCPVDAVVSGTVCMDKYEASVWRVPDPLGANKGLVKKTRQGKATAADLAAGGATQLGVGTDDYAPCVDNGQNCTDDIYAVSLPSVTPSSNITWFQAQAACENSRKRLPSNAEWQAAVAGTPDPGGDDHTTDCSSAGSLVVAGSRASCVSARGAFDMVGNVAEWVADWVPRAATFGTWSVDISPTEDLQCFADAEDPPGGLGALLRGGYFDSGTLAGPLAVDARREPHNAGLTTGFRCAR